MKLIVGVCLMGVALAGGMGGGMGGGMAGEDSDKQCCGWAIMDECETNPFWMKVNCQKSCGTVGCTVAEAKSNAMGATGACVSQLDMAALASCPWNKEFLQANWNSASVAAPVDPAPAVPAAPVDPVDPAPATEESEFIVPDAAPDMGGYGAEKPEIIVEEVLPEIQADEPAATTMEPTDAPTTAAATTMAPTTAAPTTAAPTTIAATEAPTTAAPTTAAATEAPEALEETAEAPEAPEAPEEEEETPEALAAEDMSDSCCGWAAYEECGKNSAWMATNCAKSCFVTDGQVDNEAAIANAEEQCAEYRELFLAGVPLGGQKEKAPETPVEEEEAAPEAPVDAEEAPEASEAPEEVPEVAPEAPEASEVEEAPEATEAPVEEAEEAPAMDPVVEDNMNGGYRRKFRASRRN